MSATYVIRDKATGAIIAKGYRSYEAATTRGLAWAAEHITGNDTATTVAEVMGTAGPRDKAAGYSVCMWCEETGDVADHDRLHSIMWDLEPEPEVTTPAKGARPEALLAAIVRYWGGADSITRPTDDGLQFTGDEGYSRYQIWLPNTTARLAQIDGRPFNQPVPADKLIVRCLDDAPDAWWYVGTDGSYYHSSTGEYRTLEVV